MGARGVNAVGDVSGLKELFKGKAVIVGIGNVLRGDDGLGPCLVERLAKKLAVPCFNVESSLDRYVGAIARESPDHVLFLDAVILGRKPGAFELLGTDDLVDTKTSTHDLTPRSSTDMLKLRIGGKLHFLGVQPKQVGLGEPMSPEVKQTVRRLDRQITRAARTGAKKRE